MNKETLFASIGIILGGILFIGFIYHALSEQDKRINTANEIFNQCISINSEKIFERVENCIQKGGKANQCERYVKSTIC